MTDQKPDIGFVCVDVANVVRDDSLPYSGLDRLELISSAWRAQISRHAEIKLVVDRSLLGDLGKDERRRVRQRRSRGELLVVGDGDDLLLDLAEAHRGCVLSRDRFLDKREGRRWVAGRFFTWSMSDGEAKIGPQESRNTQPFDISRKKEQKLAQALGLPDLRHPVARRRWACRSEGPCATREATPDFLQALPLLRCEEALCPGCRHPLHDLGPRPAEAEIKLVVDGVAISRFSIEQGETIRFGRLAMPDSPTLAELAWEGAFDDIGRTHVDLRLLGKHLAVQAVDEAHPIWVRHWKQKGRLFARERRLRHADGITAIGLRDTLLLGERLEMQRSGRSISEAEAIDATGSDAAWRHRVTAR